MKSGPDFLCVGMQKAATRTLHSFLSLDHRFWMPVIKEFHHFDDPSRTHEDRHRKVLDQLPVLERGGLTLAAWNLARRITQRRRLTDNDLRFLRMYRSYLDGGRSDADYMNLFSACPDDRITGDITPAYSALDAGMIARVREHLPDARILLVIRDPVSRVWSHTNMSVRKRLRKADGTGRRTRRIAMEDAMRSEDYLARLMKPSVLGKSFPTKIYRNWAAAYPGAVEVFSFEEVCSQQRAVADRIATLFGFPAAPTVAGDGILVRNRKSSEVKIPMGDRERRFLVDHFRDELFECREMFGEERTPGWLERYGLA